MCVVQLHNCVNKGLGFVSLRNAFTIILTKQEVQLCTMLICHYLQRYDMFTYMLFYPFFLFNLQNIFILVGYFFLLQICIQIFLCLIFLPLEVDYPHTTGMSCYSLCDTSSNLRIESQLRLIFFLCRKWIICMLNLCSLLKLPFKFKFSGRATFNCDVQRYQYHYLKYYHRTEEGEKRCYLFFFSFYLVLSMN